MSTPPPLFVYGTLMFGDVLDALLDRVPASSPAQLPGWRAAALRGLPFPGLVEAPGSTVTGRLLGDLTAAERQVVHEFEGDLYDLRPVVLEDGRAAATYVWRDSALVLPHDWDPAHFAAHHLATYSRP